MVNTVVEMSRLSYDRVTIAATDEELQNLGGPPICSGNEDEWNERSFAMRSYASLLSPHVAALFAGAADNAVPDRILDRIEATPGIPGGQAAQKLVHTLVTHVRGPALSAI